MSRQNVIHDICKIYWLWALDVSNLWYYRVTRMKESAVCVLPIVGMVEMNSFCFKRKRMLVLPAFSRPSVTTLISIFGPMCTRLSWKQQSHTTFQLVKYISFSFLFCLYYFNILANGCRNKTYLNCINLFIEDIVFVFALSHFLLNFRSAQIQWWAFIFYFMSAFSYYCQRQLYKSHGWEASS